MQSSTPTLEKTRIQNRFLTATEMVDYVLLEAITKQASDIHITPEKEVLRIRMRIDGMLEDLTTLPLSAHLSILARIKILTGLRTDEHFSAQDGRFTFVSKERAGSDVRVSIAPTYFGENAVLRLLSANQEVKSLRSLGCRNSHQLVLTRALERAHGMILVTGPTGSGKTTLLYTLLKMLDNKTRSIVTLEDPIEYSLPGISQVPISATRGLTFANGLKSILRQDPDVIMVGEIRDAETARLAINASLTGHLVFSSLHTNDAVSTLARLSDIGIEPYLIASTIRVIVAQRLVRVICDRCKTAHKPEERALEQVRKLVAKKISGDETFFKGEGCSHCQNTGYRGRTGIYEILIVDSVIREAILSEKSLDELYVIAKERGMLTLAEDGLEKARKGITTVEEISRITYE